MSHRLQTALVILLSLGSLATVGFNLVTARVPKGRERELHEQQLREASRRMVAGVAEAGLSESPGRSEADFEATNRSLASISHAVLRDYPGVEGGFYLGAADRFAGYAFPTRVHGPKEPKDGRLTDPPPKESPYLRLQARESLSAAADEERVTLRYVDASLVMMLTQPVGSHRPAAVSTWVMHRLIDPKQFGDQVRRYQASTVLALGGVSLALILAFGLARSLRRQRQEETRLREELRRSEHLASLGKLLAGVAHEVRNPLAAIRSTVQLWQRLPDTARTPASLDAVVRAVDRLNQTVSQLLTFSRADGTQREPLAVGALLGETLDLIAAQAAEQSIERQLEVADDLPAVVGSASALKQVFLNLATNSLQAMPDGGRLSVTARRQASGSLELLFSDTGPGIAADDRRHLFEPFFTTRPEGTGLGLALCREIVVQHGGSIECLEDGAHGATFRIVLPEA